MPNGERRVTARALATRARVLEAARTCVSERGVFGASSNEIARRAGVSWGVIQYHFGTREGILLAMIEEGFEALLGVLDKVNPSTASSTHEQVELVVDAIWRYCTQPDYLLYMDVLRPLSRDPAAAKAMETMLRHTEQALHQRINRLLPGSTASPATIIAARSLIFATMRGLALKLSFTPAGTAPGDGIAERRLLVHALTLALDGA
jgi:AcrR family transcriptional regulator